MVCSKTEAIWAEESLKGSVLLAGESRSSCQTRTANLQTLQMLLWRLNSNIKVTNKDLLLEIELLSENRSIAFNNNFNSTKRLVVNAFGGKHFDKYYYSSKIEL